MCCNYTSALSKAVHKRCIKEVSRLIWNEKLSNKTLMGEYETKYRGWMPGISKLLSTKIKYNADIYMVTSVSLNIMMAAIILF